MLEDYGSAFKQIREDKRLSIRELEGYSKNLDKDLASSRSSISKFEIQSTNISFPKLSLLLNILNVSVAEYALHAEEVVDPVADDFDSIASAFDQRDLKTLKYLEERYNANSDKLPRNKHMKLICNSLIRRINNDLTNEGMLSEIEEYLLNTDYWHYYEFALFSNTMFLFDIERLDTLLKRAVERMEIYSTFNKHTDELSIMLSNAIGHLLENNHRKLAKKYLTILKAHLTKHPRAIYEKIRYKFFVGLDECLYGNKEEGVKIIRTMIEELRGFDLTIEADKYENFLNSKILDD